MTKTSLEHAGLKTQGAQIDKILDETYLEPTKQNINKQNTNKNNFSGLVYKNAEFAFDLYSKLKVEKGNIFFSPFSVSVLMAMLKAGAVGNTDHEISTVLHFDDDPKNSSTFHNSFSALLQELNMNTFADNEIYLANRLWLSTKFSAMFEKVITNNYFSSIGQGLDKNIINRWVFDQTKGKIKNLISNIPVLSKILLTDAVYFKGQWVKKFDETYTKESDFYLLGGTEIKAMLMKNKGDFNFFKADYFSVLELPFIGRQLSMVLFLPDNPTDFWKMESSLGIKEVNQLSGFLQPEVVDICLPKFTINFSLSLKTTLMSMGLTKPFEPAKADFSGITKEYGVFLHDVFHKAYISVDEEGTEAAAASAFVVAVGGASSGKSYSFCANHPFVFFIKDNNTASIIFMGRVLDPRQ